MFTMTQREREEKLLKSAHDIYNNLCEACMHSMRFKINFERMTQSEKRELVRLLNKVNEA